MDLKVVLAKGFSGKVGISQELSSTTVEIPENSPVNFLYRDSDVYSRIMSELNPFVNGVPSIKKAIPGLNSDEPLINRYEIKRGEGGTFCAVTTPGNETLLKPGDVLYLAYVP